MTFISCKRYYHIFKTFKLYYKLTYILGKAAIQRFSPAGIANQIFQIGDQCKIRAEKTAIEFYITHTPEYQNYPQLALFPYPVQSLLVDQYKITRKEIVAGEKLQEV